MAPRVSVTTQKITRAGLVPAMTAPTVDGDVIDCGAVALYVNNASGGVCTVTVQSPVQVDGLDVSELAVAVAAGTTRLIGPFPARTFGQASGSADAGRAYVNYSVQASVTRAVVAF